MIDLREHFGIWDQCGNTRFFKKQNPWSEIYLNPIDGVMIAARDESKTSAQRGREPRYTLVVKDATRGNDEEVKKAFAANEPWVERTLDRFFYNKALGWALDAIKKHYGSEPMPGDKDLGNFLKIYESGGERYRKEGTGAGVELLREEVLEGILRVLNSMDGITADYGRNLSQEALDMALAEHGILECA